MLAYWSLWWMPWVLPWMVPLDWRRMQARATLHIVQKGDDDGHGTDR